MLGARPERESAKDLVPEQASKAEEERGREGGAGQDAGVPGPLQSPDHGRGGGGWLLLNLSYVNPINCIHSWL